MSCIVFCTYSSIKSGSRSVFLYQIDDVQLVAIGCTSGDMHFVDLSWCSQQVQCIMISRLCLWYLMLYSHFTMKPCRSLSEIGNSVVGTQPRTWYESSVHMIPRMKRDQKVQPMLETGSASRRLNDTPYVSMRATAEATHYAIMLSPRKTIGF